MLRMESWKTLAVPWKVPVMVAGRMDLAAASISLVAWPSEVPGLSAKEIVTEGNWPECGMLCGPALATSFATALSGTISPVSLLR